MRRVFGIVISALAVSLVLTTTATAQTDSFALDRFRAGKTVDDGFHINRPQGIGHLKFHGQIHIDYANDPLVWELNQGDADTEIASIVNHQLVGTVGLAFGLWDRLIIFAGLPMNLWQDGDSEAELNMHRITGVKSDGFGIGNVYVGARGRLLGELEDMFSLGLQVNVTIPSSGSDQNFIGEDGVAVHPELLAELRFGEFRATFNAGYRWTETRKFFNLTLGSDVTWGVGLTYALLGSYKEAGSRLDLHLQTYGDFSVAEGDEANNFLEREVTQLEATAGAKYHHSSGFTVGLAGGAGLQRGLGSPDVRIIGMLGFGMPRDPKGPQDRDGDGIYDADDQCPDVPEDLDGVEDEDGCPEEAQDRDKDGIIDENDHCPDDPEDIDTFEDENGCPDPDNDQDDVLDVNDGAPMDPEDKDGFEDEDGVPDPDNDKDGLLDRADECPNVAGPPENRGCPDTDRDGDGVIDRLDNCPDKKGSVKNHGCRKKQLVRIDAGRLEILDKVYFRTNKAKIRSRSFRLLNNVVSVIKNHPEIRLVSIEGHTDARGKRQYNIDLSQRRAEAVVKYLTRKGLDSSRLQARGFGPDKPIIAGASSKEEHAQNRRVEFNIPKTEGISHQESEADEDTIDW